jgi:uncharacterized protein (UPF0218 family)
MKYSNNCQDLRKELTKNFKVKVYSTNDKGLTINSLRGYSGLISLLGQNTSEKLIICALGSDEQIITYKLRRGLKITFYSI